MCKKLIVLVLSFCMISSAAAGTVIWDFEGGDKHLFDLWSVLPAFPGPDDPTIAGDEALTGAGGAAGLPDNGVAWTVGPPNQFDGQVPAFEEGCHIVNGVLEYGPCNDPFGVFDTDPPSYVNSRGQSGYLNTYNLSQWGDNLHSAANDQIATSPVVILGDSAVLTVWSHGGGSGTHAPEYDTYPAQFVYTDGSSGIAVLSAEEEDMYAILGTIHTQGHSTLTEDTLDLSAFAGKRVFIEVVDAFEGGWGWLAVDEIQITNAVSKNAALIVANEDLSMGFDQAQNDRLEMMGYAVKVVPSSDIGTAFTRDDCDTYNLVVISESIFSSGADRLIGTTTPIMTQEGNIWDNWSHMGQSVAADWRDHNEVEIVNDSHPIVVDANVSMGTMLFYNEGNSCVTDLSSNIAPGAVLIAETTPAGLTDAYAIIFAIDEGAELANGTPAPARFVGFALPGQATLLPEVLTDEAWALWDASIRWLDPPPAPVPPLEAMIAWYDAQAITGVADGDALAIWPDMSGNGRDATQDDDTYKPVYVADAGNGLPAVRFDTDWLEAVFSADGLELPFTVFVVHKVTSETMGNQNIIDGGSAGPRFRLGYNPPGEPLFATFQNWPPALDADIAIETPMPDFTVVTALYNEPGATSALRVDGVEVTSSENMASYLLVDITIGSRTSRDRQWFFGDIAEMIFYDSALADEELAAVESYLADKYGFGLAP